MTVNRLYVSVADRYAPFRQVAFQGLGSDWPRGRSYWDVATFRAPYEHGYYGNLQGLGASPGYPPPECANGSGRWLPMPGPGGYTPVCPSSPEYTMAQIYAETGGGFGAVPGNLTQAIDANAPPDIKRFLLAGEPPSTVAKDVTLPFNQIPQLIYGALAVACGGLAYYSYRRHKKQHKQGEAK